MLVIVQERPTISKVDISGNKEFDTETLKKALKEIGVAEARIFDRSALDRAEQEMKRQYLSRGRYAAKVTVTVTPQERNRVAINIAIEEGDASKIARINIVGEKAFSESELLGLMTLTTPGWTTWYTKNDQYSKQKLSADLEALKSFYQNRGYLEFNVDSTQVSITPDKEDIYITVNITEGPRYTVSEVRLGGDLPIPGAASSGRSCRCGWARCSRANGCRRASRRSAIGWAPKATLSPTSTRFPRSIARSSRRRSRSIVDPGRRVYIRKININGNVRTRDEVIRREMRQLESAWYDGARIERSKVRIRRLGYFDDVNIETPPVAGAPDQADVEVTVTETVHGQPARGRRLLELGQARVQCVGVPAEHLRQRQRADGRDQHELGQPHDLADLHRAVLDGGRRVADAGSLPARTSTRRRSRSRRTSRRRWAGPSASASRSPKRTRSTSASAIDHTDLTLFTNSPLSYFRYVAEFGYVTNSIVVNLGWARDTRDDILYPTRGLLQVAGVEVGLPIVDLSYYKANYLAQWFWPFYGDFVLMLRGDVGYADGYNGKPLPFYKVFYARRRGFGARLRDGVARPARHLREYAGRPAQDRRPTPSCSIRSSRATNRCARAYSSTPGRSRTFPLLEDVGDELENLIKSEKFRYSYGVGLAWNSPVGPLKFSYGIPFKVRRGDLIQKFQFQVGSVF